MEDQRLSRRDFLRTSAIAALVMGGLAACTPAAQPAPGGRSSRQAQPDRPQRLPPHR